MSNNPPPYGPPPGSGDPYGQPQQPAQPYGPPPGQPGAYPGGPQPAYGNAYGGAPYGPPSGRTSKKWYQRWWVWVVAVIAIIIIAVVVIAAVVGNKYALESKIKELVKGQGLTVSDVKCPNNIDTDKGNEYNCTAVINGQSTSLHVRFDEDRHFILTRN